MNCIVIEDDVLSRKLVENYIKKVDFLKLEQSFSNAISALSFLSENTIDLIFLDIEMPEMTGIEFIRAIQQKMPQVILTTSHNEFALEAFEYNVTDYIVKPVDYTRFHKAVMKAKGIHKENNDGNNDDEHGRAIIAEANLKIQDSIKYAKKIQNSILPQEVVLQDLFKESFILFRAKDVVSGDFPFVLKKDDYIYFAAVDCTGHGVPGALLSVIGSLILNELLTYEPLIPSVVLDKLHTAVVKTLRQGQTGGENERDGMDIGMCRLNLKTGEFMFSGAHRPLYIVRHNQKPGEEPEEIKGDKYPIGGVQYRGRGMFTNFETMLKKGDKIFVCTDGYADQFGGDDPLEPKKIGSKKIRKILVDNKDRSMAEVHNKLVYDDGT
jgi:DNA-binding NarL/FixJ family response regulator